MRMPTFPALVLAGALYDRGGVAVTDRTVTWSTSDTMVATGTTTGRLIARAEGAATGRAFVYATAEGVTGQVEVEVAADAGALRLFSSTGRYEQILYLTFERNGASVESGTLIDGEWRFFNGHYRARFVYEIEC